MSQIMGVTSTGYTKFEPSDEKQSTSYTPIVISYSEEMQMDMISGENISRNFNFPFVAEPVYVQKINGDDVLVYYSNIMEIGKKYPVIWNNEHFILIKNEFNIDFYKFFPDR